MSLKRGLPELRFNPKELNVTGDEMDIWRQYSIANPSLSQNAIMAGTAGTAATNTTINQIIPDYPRNLQFSIAGSAAGMAGTLIMNGKDQFGSVIQETITFSPASNGGTGVGTLIFAQFTSGTVYYGTAVGNGTMGVGYGTAGTTALFGLPDRVGSASDVIGLSIGSATGAFVPNGGTIQGYVSVARSAIKAPKDLTGSITYIVLYHPTFVNEAYRQTGMSSVA